MSISAWIGLAATTFAAALLQAAGGFGFAVVATPLYLMIAAPVTAVHLAIIIATALSVIVLPQLHHAVARGLLTRLLLGSCAGLPLGLLTFRHSNPAAVRLVAGAVVLGFAGLLAMTRKRTRPVPIFRMSPARDLAAGAVSGAATALVGMAGPPLLIYLLLAGAGSQMIRATLLAFFAVVYAASLTAHTATVGIAADTWLNAGIVLPFAIAGGVIGRPLGDRLGAGGFTALAIGLLAAAGLFTLFE
jgi:uncharacterized protein